MELIACVFKKSAHPLFFLVVTTWCAEGVVWMWVKRGRFY